jgi:hypothetical protein
MFRVDAARYRKAIPELLRIVRVSQHPQLLRERAVSGWNATALLPSIPNGGFD